MSFLGWEHNVTTTYHPQANGMVERFHRQLKAAAATTGHAANWYNKLPWVLLGIRTALKEDLGASSSELTFGKTIRLPGQYFETAPDYWVNIPEFRKKLLKQMQDVHITPPRQQKIELTSYPRIF